MAALKTLAPILFMAGLGWLCRVRGWVSEEQKDGANRIVFGILFPLMVFDLLASTSLHASISGVVAVILGCYCLYWILARTVLKRYFAPYSAIAPYLLTTAEGGGFALPLYVSIVGTKSADAGYPMLLDLAGVIFCFLVIPLLLAGSAGHKAGPGEIAQRILHSPMVLAAFAGLLANVTGLYQQAQSAAWFPVFSQVVSTVEAPVVPMILFIIGYNLRFSSGILKPAAKLVLVRVLLFLGILGILYLAFPSLMASWDFAMAAWLYFMGPVGFGVIAQIDSLMNSGQDRSYCSSVISLNMAVTLVVYVAIVLLQG